MKRIIWIVKKKNAVFHKIDKRTNYSPQIPFFSLYVCATGFLIFQRLNSQSLQKGF